MPLIPRLLLVFSAFLGTAACAQSNWQQRADLLASGAASSIVVFHLCEGERGSRADALRAHALLEKLALAMAGETGADLRTVQVYLADSANLKVRALWQSVKDKPCAQTKNLRVLAQHTGFDVPAGQ